MADEEKLEGCTLFGCKFLDSLSIEKRLASLTPAERLAGLTLAERMVGLDGWCLMPTEPGNRGAPVARPETEAYWHTPTVENPANEDGSLFW